ncbi:MAG TPA: septum formation initiator family protein [Acidimicrobiia bacterium]|nr:septum formation initiator family protein [Acidimicrobiia bacterium]
MRSRSGVALVTLLFILMGAAFLTQVVPYRQILDSRRQVETAQDQLASIEAENEVLAADVAALNTPEEVERLARDKLGYVRDGETAYVVLDPPGAEAPQSHGSALPQPSDKTWVDVVWDFITGGDLDSSG